MKCMFDCVVSQLITHDSTNFPFGEDCIARTFIEKFDMTSISVARLSPEPERVKVFVILVYQTGFKGEDGI